MIIYLEKKEKSVFALDLMFDLVTHNILKYLRFLILKLNVQAKTNGS